MTSAAGAFAGEVSRRRKKPTARCGYVHGAVVQSWMWWFAGSVSDVNCADATAANTSTVATAADASSGFMTLLSLSARREGTGSSSALPTPVIRLMHSPA